MIRFVRYDLSEGRSLPYFQITRNRAEASLEDTRGSIAGSQEAERARGKHGHVFVVVSMGETRQA